MSKDREIYIIGTTELKARLKLQAEKERRTMSALGAIILEDYFKNLDRCSE